MWDVITQALSETTPDMRTSSVCYLTSDNEHDWPMVVYTLALSDFPITPFTQKTKTLDMTKDIYDTY